MISVATLSYYLLDSKFEGFRHSIFVVLWLYNYTLNQALDTLSQIKRKQLRDPGRKQLRDTENNLYHLSEEAELWPGIEYTSASLSFYSKLP